MPTPPLEGVPALAPGPGAVVSTLALAGERALSPMARLSQRDRGRGGVDIQVPVPDQPADDGAGDAAPPAAEASSGLPRTGLALATPITLGLAMAAAGLALLALSRARLEPRPGP